MSYVKLFGSILHSTIWQQPDHVRLVWITMLALKDRDGVVEASIPGLAQAARQTIEATEDALAVLMAPDRYSRTPDHEGRRIEPVDGGWLVLNHDKYRDKLDADDQREKAAERKRRQRGRQRERQEPENQGVTVTPVTLGHALSHDVRHADADADADQDPLPLGSDPSGLPDPGTAVRADLEPPPAEPPPELELELWDGWMPEPELELERRAVALGVDLTAELRKLHDRARGRGSKSGDWQATWRTWVQRAIEWAGKDGPTPVARAAPSGRGAGHRAAASAEIERDREEERRRSEAAARDRDEVARIAAQALDQLRGVSR